MTGGSRLKNLKEEIKCLENCLIKFTELNKEELENIKEKYELEYLNEYCNKLLEECKENYLV